MPLIQRLPKSVRGPLAGRLAGTIEQLLRDPSGLNWWKFLTFSFRFLRSPDRDSSPAITNAAAIRASLSSEDTSLIHNPCFEISQLFCPNSDKSKLLISRCNDGDIFSTLRILTSEDTMAPHNVETVAALRSKHPSAPTGPELPEPTFNPDFQPLSVDSESILNTVKSMKSGSGAGMDGVRPFHLQQMLGADTAEQGRRLLSALTSLTNLVLQGGVPDFARDAFYGASLIALAKKGSGIRPIAVGSVYRRLASKICARFTIGLTQDSLKISVGGWHGWWLRGYGTCCQAVHLHPRSCQYR